MFTNQEVRVLNRLNDHAKFNEVEKLEAYLGVNIFVALELLHRQISQLELESATYQQMLLPQKVGFRVIGR